MSGACGRPTKAGSPCRKAPVRWLDATTPDPRGCFDHLTKTDQEIFIAVRRARQEAEAAREPACWSWALPTEEFRSALREKWAWYPPILVGDSFDALVMEEWHEGRCAVCGVTGEHLVGDHDHATSLERGYLCRSCNTSEGMNGGGVWWRYRERNPASILGVKTRYVGPFCEDPDDVPYVSDKWKNNPMKGIGL